jgi:uncharacterized protein
VNGKLLSRYFAVYSFVFLPLIFMATEQTINVRPPVWALITAVIIGGVFYIAGKQIEASPEPEQLASITVSGDGRVFATPDIAQLSVGVQTGRQATAGAAMEKLKISMDAVIAAVKAQGIDEKDITTQSFWLNPVYDYANGRQIPQGFEASQSLSIKVRDLDDTSDVLGAATAAGANQAGGVTFTVDNPETKKAEARLEAIKEAQDKAELLARQLGVELGDIISFNEGYGGYPPPMYYDKAMLGVGGGADMAEQAVQLPVGEQEVNVSVSITYELED